MFICPVLTLGTFYITRQYRIDQNARSVGLLYYICLRHRVVRKNVSEVTFLSATLKQQSEEHFRNSQGIVNNKKCSGKRITSGARFR